MNPLNVLLPRIRLPKLSWKICILGILAAAAGLRLYRAMMGDLSEDPYHHWLVSAYLAERGTYTDPFGAAEIWPPGYHIAGAGVLFVLGRDIMWLKLLNILFSLGGIYLAYLIAGRSRPAGILAALFLALNPFELLTSSTSYTEPMAVFFFLLAIYLIDHGREKAAGMAVMVSAATRYEVWLAIPFLLYGSLTNPIKKNEYPFQKGDKILHLAAPALAFIAAWSAYTAFHHGFFPESILERSQEVLNYEIGSGAVNDGVAGRTFGIIWYFLISSPLVYASGIYFAARNIKKGGLFAFTLIYLTLVFLATASGTVVGSFRYFSLVIPLLCIFGAVRVSKNKKIGAVLMVSLVIILPFYFTMYSQNDVLYQPLVRAGKFVKDTGAGGIISNSPIPLYYSGLPAGHLFGDAILRNMSHEQGIKFLQDNDVEYVVYADSPPGELKRLFPAIAKGGDVAGLEQVYDPNDWEQKYGAKRTYVYRLLNGSFRSTGSYVSSSPLIADMDGDGDGEIVAASDKLYIWKRDGTILGGFPAQTAGLIASTPNIAHTSGGAAIFVGSDDDRLYAWWYNGSSVSGFPKITGGDVFSKPLLVDMDGDGEVEIVAGSDDGRVYAWNLDGSSLPGWPLKTGGYVSSSPAAADLDGDGKPEVLAGSWDKKLYAWHADGSLLPGFPLKTGGAIWAAPRITDLDGDGSPDIVAASDMVYAWNSRGEMRPGFPLMTGSYIVASPAVEDIDLDGNPEIIVASDSVYVFNSSGGLKPGWPVYTGYYFWASPSVVDIDGDGLPEIIIGDWGGYVYAFKPDGRTVSGFPKHTNGKIFASVAAGDIDRDGTVEVVAGSWDKNIYLWSVKDNGSYRREYGDSPKIASGKPVLNGISSYKDNGVIFIEANLTGTVERAELYYFEDDGTWHPSPMVMSEGMHVGMIAPQRQAAVKYYITMESENNPYRFPKVSYYETRN